MRQLLRSCALAGVVALSLAACGGDDASTPLPDDGLPTTLPGDLGTLPTDDPSLTFPPFEEELVEVPDIQIRFANYMYDAEGAGVTLDLYWASTEGSKGPTLEYGAVTDWMPVKVPSYAATGGDVSLAAPLVTTGSTDLFSPIQYVSQTLQPGDRVTFILGNSRSFDGKPQYQYGFVFEGQMGPAPAGKALIVFNETPNGAIEGGDFMSLYTEGACEQWFIDNSVPTGNGGTGYVVDPGVLQVFGSDANSDCSVATPTVEIDATEGSIFLVIAHGTTRENRELTVLPIA